MNRHRLGRGQLVFRLGLALVCLAVIAFCAGNVGPDLFK